MKLIEAEKAKDVIHEYFKSLMAKDASGADVYKLAVGIVSCLEHDANLLKAIDELPPAEQDTTTHDSIPVETGKNDGDGNSGDCISRTQAIDTLRKMQTYKLFAGDDMILIDKAGVQTELMMLPPIQPDIIRCKDCAYCDSDVVDAPYGMTKKIFWCDRLYAGANENLIVEPDDFCSFAERREDE